MSLVVRIDCQNNFCDLTLPKSSEQTAKINAFLARFKETIWDSLVLHRVDKKHIVVSLPLAFLCSLATVPYDALCDRERAILKESKTYERKTQFYLARPGGLILSTAALLCGIAAGVSYFYGVNPPQIEFYKTALLMGMAATLTALASNLLGFYITGTLPNSASEADNKEQNMWDDFMMLKAKPAAFQLIDWYSPLLKPAETAESFVARRELAKALVQSVPFNDVITYYKSQATQLEKIDVAFRFLLEAKELIEEQMSLEETASSGYLTLRSELSIAAKLLGYYQ